MAEDTLKEQVRQLHSQTSPSLLLLVVPSHCSLWGESHTCLSHTSPIRWQEGARWSSFIWDHMSRCKGIRRESWWLGTEMGKGTERKEESEERLSQLPPFVSCELVHQLGRIVKTYPKTRVNSDLQLFSKLSHSRCTLPSRCVMYEHGKQGLLDLSTALNSGFKQQRQSLTQHRKSRYSCALCAVMTAL